MEENPSTDWHADNKEYLQNRKGNTPSMQHVVYTYSNTSVNTQCFTIHILMIRSREDLTLATVGDRIGLTWDSNIFGALFRVQIGP